MKKLSIFFALFVIVTSFFPLVMSAQNPTDIQGGNFQIVPCGGTDNPATPEKEDVECDYNALINGINRIVKYFIYIAHFFAVGMFMYAGFLYLFAGENPGNKQKAKDVFKYILIGLFFVYAGWLIVYTLLDKLIPNDSKIIPAGQTKNDVIQLKN